MQRGEAAISVRVTGKRVDARAARAVRARSIGRIEDECAFAPGHQETNHDGGSGGGAA